MMLPILISLSVAPGLYFFCASAGAAKTSAAEIAAKSMNLLGAIISSSGEPCSWGARPFLMLHAGVPPHAAPRRADRTGYPFRHHIHEADQKNAVDRPGCRLRDLVRDVGDELDEERAVERPRDRGEPTDHDTDQEADRQEDVEAVGCDELHGDGAKRTGNAGEQGADPEGQRFIKRRVDPHRLGGDGIVPDRHDGASYPPAQQVPGEDEHSDRNRQAEEIEPLILIDR